MSNPFEALELTPFADPEEIRAAYRKLVKQCHTDMIQDPEEKKQAQARMVQLNLAYEEALRMAVPKPRASATPELTKEDAIALAEKMLARNNPESALRQLLRAESRDAFWHYTQGRVLMRMEQYDSAHQSFREAIRMDPENREYRRSALDATIALRKSQTLQGKLKKFWKDISVIGKRN